MPSKNAVPGRVTASQQKSEPPSIAVGGPLASGRKACQTGRTVVDSRFSRLDDY
jgi:hypothetical protein